MSQNETLIPTDEQGRVHPVSQIVDSPVGQNEKRATAQAAERQRATSAANAPRDEQGRVHPVPQLFAEPDDRNEREARTQAARAETGGLGHLEEKRPVGRPPGGGKKWSQNATVCQNLRGRFAGRKAGGGKCVQNAHISITCEAVANRHGVAGDEVGEQGSGKKQFALHLFMVY
jgi:hypothetical protein